MRLRFACAIAMTLPIADGQDREHHQHVLPLAVQAPQTVRREAAPPSRRRRASGAVPTNMVTGVSAPSYTSGIHMWNGAAPSLNAMPVTTNTSPRTRMRSVPVLRRRADTSEVQGPRRPVHHRHPVEQHPGGERPQHEVLHRRLGGDRRVAVEGDHRVEREREQLEPEVHGEEIRSRHEHHHPEQREEPEDEVLAARLLPDRVRRCALQVEEQEPADHEGRELEDRGHRIGDERPRERDDRTLGEVEGEDEGGEDQRCLGEPVGEVRRTPVDLHHEHHARGASRARSRARSARMPALPPRSRPPASQSSPFTASTSPRGPAGSRRTAPSRRGAERARAR